MAVTPAEEIHFDEDDLSSLARRMVALAGTESGWINFSPEVEHGHEPPPRSFGSILFSSRGAPVPLVTWSAPEEPGGPATIGIQHGAGPKALTQLAERDLALPAGWWKRSDHPRRGLVVTVPAEVDAEDVLWWLLSAAHTLCAAPLTGSWLAKVFQP